MIISDSYQSSNSSDSLVETSNKLASIQEFMVEVRRHLDQIESSLQNPHPIGIVTDETVPYASQTTQLFHLELKRSTKTS